MLATLQEVLIYAKRKHAAIAAFNIYSYEDAKGCVEAAEELNTPVILAANHRALDYMPLAAIGPMLRGLAEEASVPVVVHLDHAKDISVIDRALKNGFTSVMFDGSSLPIEENIKETLQAKKLAQTYGAHIEAEVGKVGYTNDVKEIETAFTNVQEAAYFYDETKVNALAVSVGTTHRMETKTADLDFSLINEIERLVDCPLVLHGASGVPEAMLKKLATETNFGKVNIGTVIRKAFGDTLRTQIINNPGVYDRLEFFPVCIKQVKEVAKKYIKLLHREEL